MKRKLNIETAKILVELYREIGIKTKLIELKYAEYNEHHTYLGNTIARELFGFGTIGCLLCKSAILLCGTYLSNYCINCIYSYHIKKEQHYFCLKGKNASTYEAIRTAQTPHQFISAVLARADHIESIINRIERKK